MKPKVINRNYEVHVKVKRSVPHDYNIFQGRFSSVLKARTVLREALKENYVISGCILRIELTREIVLELNKP